MKVAVSSCLLGCDCKYNGGNNRHERLLALLKGHEVIAVCPETAGGLPTPRPSCEIVKGVVLDKTGVSKDAAYRLGARLCLRQVLNAGAQLAVLQARSPSCGVHHIYDGTFSGTLIPGRGVFAALLQEAGITAVDTEDIPENITHLEMLKKVEHV